MQSSLYLFPLEVIDEFLDWSVEILDSASPHVSANWVAAASRLPAYRGTVISLFPVAFGEHPGDTLAALEPFEQNPLLKHALVHRPPGPWSYDEGYGLLAQIYQKGLRYRADALWVEPDRPGFREAMKPLLATLPTRHSHVLWAPWNTAAPLRPNSAYSLHTALSVHPYGICEKAEQDAAMNAWVNESLRALEPFSIHGGKVNDNDLSAYPKYVLSPENAARLERLRSRYDPEGFFHGYLDTPRPAA